MPDLRTLYKPETIAVVGASNSPGKVGNAVVKNLISCGFPGRIVPVNPKEDEIEGLKCYASVADIPEQVEQAVMCIPAPFVPAAMEECGEEGVSSVVVITAGFKEASEEGAELERQLVEICEKYDMNMMGPNCLGVIDTHTPINASFSGVFPITGNIAFFSQSGALCLAILDWSLEEGLGFSKFISMGNKADLNEADFVADVADDPDTDVILLYLESIEDGPAFMEAAKKASLKKPVVVLKAGVSASGAKAASSHTGALAGSDAGYEAAFRQSGVLRARTMEEQFTKAMAFAYQAVPEGKRVAIVTNAGGTGVVSTDAVELSGLQLADLTEETMDELREKLPAMASVKNPVDVIGDAGPDRYRHALEHSLSDPNVDMALVLLCPTAFTDPMQTAADIKEFHGKYPDKPIIASFTGGASVKEATSQLFSDGIPTFAFPEPAVSCLKGLVDYGERREALRDAIEVTYEGDDAEVRSIFQEVREDGRRVLLGPEAMAVARAYGIGTTPSELATTAPEAGQMADDMGYPVVLKVASPEIIHKTDIGGVVLGLEDEDSVRRAFEDIMAATKEHEPDATVYGVEVQKMFPKGEELIVGLSTDPVFGPLLMFGMGGVFVDLMKDVSFRVAHGLTDIDLDEMIEGTRAYELLRGYRGDEPKDIDAVKETMGRIAQLSRDFSEIQELDINPFFAYTDGVAALDVKITLKE
ncbi:MAG: acetate--CoA ligase family protein [Bacillota bacterium]